MEIEENSELDLLVSYKAHAGDKRIPEVCADMAAEMGEGRYYPEMLERMAQFELTLLDWAEAHKGARKYVAFADKCWPAFPEQFGFEPCFVNSRLASRGIPVSCEVDIYGALSEYIGSCVSQDAVTLLDINNSVPAKMWEDQIKGKFDYSLTDTFKDPILTSPAARWKATSLPARSPSTACSATVTAISAPTSLRARFCPSPPPASAASASSPSMRWAASIAMC